MKENKIGSIISKRRKELGLTQQELADKLSVSSKTISKWECNNGLPDITMLKKISFELGISVEDLLEGNTKSNKENIQNPKSPKLRKIFLIICLLTLIIITILILNKQTKPSETKIEQNNCTIIKTYNIKNIDQSNDENYLYVTITEYQVEGTFTIKLPKSLSEELKSGNAYVFTFKTTEENINTTTDTLFANSEIINIKYTEKVGMESENSSYCDKASAK